MNISSRIAALTATALLGAGLAVSDAAPASAAGISCGQAVYDPALEGVVHSCDGTGLVQYTIDCFWPPDVQFTHRWTYGASKVLPYTCNGRGEVNVTFTLV